jgi:hypothetical protein
MRFCRFCSGENADDLGVEDIQGGFRIGPSSRVRADPASVTIATPCSKIPQRVGGSSKVRVDNAP